MEKTVLLELSFDELDQLTENTSVFIADDYKNYSVDQLDKFVRSAGFLLGTLRGLQRRKDFELSNYLYDLYWDYTHEVLVDMLFFEIVEKYFFSCVELAVKVIAGGAADE